jgi:hypothetical protein
MVTDAADVLTGSLWQSSQSADIRADSDSEDHMTSDGTTT